MTNKTSKLQDIQNEFDKLQREKSATLALLESYPESMPAIDLLVYYDRLTLCSFTVVYRVSTVAEAASLIKEWNPYTLSLYYNQGEGFRTMEHGLKSDKNQVYPVTIEVSKYGVNFSMYAMLGGLLVHVKIESPVNSNLAYVRYFTHHGRYNMSRGSSLVVNGLKDGFKVVSWWTPRDTPSSYTIYWTIDDMTPFVDLLKDGQI